VELAVSGHTTSHLQELEDCKIHILVKRPGHPKLAGTYMCDLDGVLVVIGIGT
jgi:hypothetical protein